MAALGLALPARSFFVGDPGVKLVAARSALAHPARPLDIDLPRIGGGPAAFVDPFYQVHGDHAHAVTSPVFPLLAAPLIAAFGLRGAYVLPALGFLAALAGIAWVGVRLDPRRSPSLLVLVGALCTPLLFYGLEFWEHTPAVAVAALGSALLLGRRPFAGGLLLGVGALLRPEAAWYAAAAVVSEGSLTRPTDDSETTQRPLRDRSRTCLAGIAIAVAPVAIFWLVHAGTPFGPHVSGNLTPLPGWTSSRLATLHVWFGSLTARESLWATAPAVALALILPLGAGWRGRPFLWSTLLGYLALVVLTAPNDGGGQWGPRYLLFAFIPLTILIADALATVSRRGRIGAIASVAVLLLSLWVQRAAYKELRAAKTTYARVVDFVERECAPGGFLLTDLWWLDQATAALYPTRVMLFADTDADAIRAVRLLDAAGVRGVTLVRGEGAAADDAIRTWLRDSRYRVVARDEMADGLVAWRVTSASTP